MWVADVEDLEGFVDKDSLIRPQDTVALSKIIEAIARKSSQKRCHPLVERLGFHLGYHLKALIVKLFVQSEHLLC